MNLANVVQLSEKVKALEGLLTYSLTLSADKQAKMEGEARRAWKAVSEAYDAAAGTVKVKTRKARKPLTDDQKKALRERLAKAREARKTKKKTDATVSPAKKGKGKA